jgi:hypothetical protein
VTGKIKRKVGIVFDKTSIEINFAKFHCNREEKKECFRYKLELLHDLQKGRLSEKEEREKKIDEFYH